MKTIFLTGCFLPEVSADVHLNNDIAHELANHEEVVVITPYPSRGIDKESSFYKYEVINSNLSIYRIGKNTASYSSILLRGLKHFTQAIGMFIKILSLEYDTIIITSTPPILGYLSFLIPKKKNIIFLVRDVFPDSYICYKGHINSLLEKVLRKLEKSIYKKCNKIITISEDMKKTLIGKGVENNKISVVYNWISTKEIKPIERKNNQLFKEFNLDANGFYVVYAGNIGKIQSIDTIIDAAKIVKEKTNDISFLLIGNGSDKERIQQIIVNDNCSNVKLFDLQASDRVSEVYSIADINLITLKENTTNYAFPSKAWTALATARPVICAVDTNSELARMVERTNCGVCIEPENDTLLANVILDMYKKSESLKVMGNSGRDFIEREMDKHVGNKQMINEIEKMELN